ncbi:hypothetical protein GKE82_23705 [Conexibacter sp. W3-3-2]|uniref:hypothetical protein n=1 Tax=Conexibacter sp. W3-3-2 TaxID=2675227 RepID=UPI0012B9E565|nr:hypothetical protein [Conexibacter sp. W3-3-2]MTD47212.1 hypothetical protein [Conexibacter sp. W3-3-2]
MTMSERLGFTIDWQDGSEPTDPDQTRLHEPTVVTGTPEDFRTARRQHARGDLLEDQHITRRYRRTRP